MTARCNLIIDSCCDLPPNVVNRPGVELVRFPFVCDGDERLDDLWQSTDMHAFYERMRKGASPTTSHPIATELRGAFERSVESGVPAVYLSFSSGLSSHFDFASTVLEEVLAKHSDVDIRIVDTRLASTGEALLVYEALRRRDDGLTVDEMEKWANEARSRVSGYFMVDDLDALRRGGRIPRAVAFAGSKLNVKPLLTIAADGKLAVAGAARGRKKGLRALAEKFAESADLVAPAVVCMGHADCEDDMNKLQKMLPGDGSALKCIGQPIGPVIGSHVGPGMVALAFWNREEREA